MDGRSSRLEQLSHVGFLSQEAQAAAAQTQSKNPSKQLAPEAIVKNLVRAWNQGDSDTVAKLFLADGVLIIPTGSVIRSRSEIRERIIKERQGKLKETTLSNTVDDVSLVDANTVVVKGKYLLDGMKILGVTTSSEGSYVFRQKKQQGQWMIAKAEVLRKKSE